MSWGAEALVINAGELTECLASVEAAQRRFGQADLVVARPSDLPFSEALEHLDAVDAAIGQLEQPLDEAGDRLVTRRVPQAAVLRRRADDALLLPVAKDAGAHPDPLCQARYGHEVVVAICHNPVR